MDEPVDTAEGPVRVDYHQFWLLDPAAVGPQLPLVHAGGNGLVIAQTDVAVVSTGIHSGVVHVSVGLYLSAPPVECGGWDEVIDFTMVSTSGRLTVHSMMADMLRPFPRLSHTGPGTYAVRAHARGRDTEPDQVVGEPVEYYRFAVWPAPHGTPAETVHKQSDRYGADLRHPPSQG